jgi:glycosyltransferase involved in cell wall biosynthesis
VRVCYFGTFDADYVRNQVLIAGLRSQDVDVFECHAPLWENTAAKVREATKGVANPRLWGQLLRVYARLIRQYLRVGAYDVMVVGYAGHLDLPLARILTWLAHKPLVFDAFLSLHETIVEDRGLAGRKSLMGAIVLGLERVDCLLADLVLLDTGTNAQYFATKYSLPERKLAHLWVGTQEAYYRPGAPTQTSTFFTVIYFGKFIPLHGIEFIIRAAKELADHADIRFEFIGGGQTYQAMHALADSLHVDNIVWGPQWLPPQELAQRIAQAEVCLGIFGTSPKAARVIPTKAYVALAMQKALVTEDSPAAREVLRPQEHALLCPAGDAKALAGCILALQEHPEIRQRIAQQGYLLFQKSFTSHTIGADMKSLLAGLVTARKRVSSDP